ncbi:MAG: DNA recombination protein RmuC [Candidatus Omnitrophica bacterium]|nr:DNA recombination protein RmuC [Candidatus Omnitrophota bacterium]
MNSLIILFVMIAISAAYLFFLRENQKFIREKNQRISELEGRLQNLQEENSKLQVEIAELRKEKESFIEKISWSEKSQEQLREAFTSLATQVLRGNTEEFLKMARQNLESIVQQLRGDWTTQKAEISKLFEPLTETLKKMDEEIRIIEKKREGAYEGLQKELQHLFSAQDQLRTLTVQLNQALKTTQVRGQWGQIQLRRVVELAGMTKHVDYEEQASSEEGRPDMIINLPNGGILPVDAKSPMLAYLEAMNEEEPKRQEKLRIFAKKVRETIGNLASKKYWAQFNPTPEFVIMFVPNEASISAAYEIEPNLLEYAIENHVLIATPVTLLGLLKAVAFGWQQHSIEENAIAIAKTGRELYERISVFVEHLRNTGKSIESTVKNYNATIASLESRLIPSIKKLQELGSSQQGIKETQYIETSLRLPDNTQEC